MSWVPNLIGLAIAIFLVAAFKTLPNNDQDQRLDKVEEKIETIGRDLEEIRTAVERLSK